MDIQPESRALIRRSRAPFYFTAVTVRRGTASVDGVQNSPPLARTNAQLGGSRCLYSPRIREEPFSETGLPANHILGNPEGIKRAGAVRETPAVHTTVRGAVVFLPHTSERLLRTFLNPLLRKVAEKTHHSPVCPPLQRTSPPRPAPSG